MRAPETFRSVLLLLAIFGLACAGLAPSSSSGGRSAASSGDMKRLADLTERNAVVCETKTAVTREKLRDAVARIEGGGGGDRSAKPRESLEGALSKLSALKVTPKLDVIGPPTMPVVVLLEPVADRSSGPASRTVAAQVELNVLREDISAINGALGAGFFSTSSCNEFALGLTRTLGALDGGDFEPSTALLSSYRRMLQASARSKTVVASSVGLIGVMEAGLAGKGAKAVGVLLNGIKTDIASPQEVTEDQAKLTYRMAGAEMRSRVAGARAGDEPGAGSPTDVGGRDAGEELVRRLVPRGTVLADATDALLALKNGDYVGALKNALTLAGRVTPLGNVLASVLSILA